MSVDADRAKPVALGVLVAGVVVLAAVVAGSLATPPAAVPPGADHPEYASEEIAVDRLENEGTPDPSGDVGTVVFDRSENNRFDREDVAPLTDAITRAGGEVRFTETHNGLATTLFEADVLVVVDPASRYDGEDLDALEQFLDDGGKVVIFGEPNRKVIQQRQFGIGLSTRRSQLTTLGSKLGITFDTQYLYDQQHNDGNFKNVLAGPPDGQNHDLVEGVEDVAMYTATSVSATDGEVLLRTASSAKQDGTAREEGYPVAVVNDRDDVLAVGDKTFLQPQYASVGDNDVFIARIVEFMADADHQPPEDGDADLVALDGSLDSPLTAGSTATAEPPTSWAVEPRDEASAIDAGALARTAEPAWAAGRLRTPVARSDPAG